MKIFLKKLLIAFLQSVLFEQIKKKFYNQSLIMRSCEILKNQNVLLVSR